LSINSDFSSNLGKQSLPDQQAIHPLPSATDQHPVTFSDSSFLENLQSPPFRIISRQTIPAPTSSFVGIMPKKRKVYSCTPQAIAPSDEKGQPSVKRQKLKEEDEDEKLINQAHRTILIGGEVLELTEEQEFNLAKHSVKYALMMKFGTDSDEEKIFISVEESKIDPEVCLQLVDFASHHRPLNLYASFEEWSEVVKGENYARVELTFECPPSSEVFERYFNRWEQGSGDYQECLEFRKFYRLYQGAIFLGMDHYATEAISICLGIFQKCLEEGNQELVNKSKEGLSKGLKILKWWLEAGSHSQEDYVRIYQAVLSWGKFPELASAYLFEGLPTKYDFVLKWLNTNKSQNTTVGRYFSLYDYRGIKLVNALMQTYALCPRLEDLFFYGFEELGMKEVFDCFKFTNSLSKSVNSLKRLCFFDFVENSIQDQIKPIDILVNCPNLEEFAIVSFEVLNIESFLETLGESGKSLKRIFFVQRPAKILIYERIDASQPFLEVKFNGVFPAWLGRQQDFHVIKNAFLKYGT